MESHGCVDMVSSTRRLCLSPCDQATDGETPLYTGRAVAALADEVASSSRRAADLSGTIQWSAELAVRHGFTDELGRQPLSARTLRRVLGVQWLPSSWVVPWWLLRLISPRYPDASPSVQLQESDTPNEKGVREAGEL